MSNVRQHQPTLMPAAVAPLRNAPNRKASSAGFCRRISAELGVHRLPVLPLYWQEPERFPYVIAAGSEIVGFALVREVGAAPQFEMAEFYVMPSRRRIGIGRRAACELFAIHRGSWQVNAMPSSAQAQAFWASVLPRARPCLARPRPMSPNPSIERTSQRPLRALWSTAHVER